MKDLVYRICYDYSSLCITIPYNKNNKFNLKKKQRYYVIRKFTEIDLSYI